MRLLLLKKRVFLYNAVKDGTMTIKQVYIFRSGELYLHHDNTLPGEFPLCFADSVIDSWQAVIGGEPAALYLLESSVSKQELAAASVSGSALAESSASGSWVRLRALFAREEPEYALLSRNAARALGLLNWHHTTCFCPRCGAALRNSDSEPAKICPACRVVQYPRICPAVIVIVRKEGRILLARHARRNQDVFTCIAGFLEHGESLEECVAREVFEETGLRVRDIRYVSSQSWPFPDQFMCAFTAEWESGDIVPDPEEITEACWFDPSDLPNHPLTGTVAWKLIHGEVQRMERKK